MALHVRQQIRAAVAGALANLPTTGPNVFQGRTWPMQASYPALLVYFRGGVSQFDALGGADAVLPLERDERLTIEGLVRSAKAEPAATSVDDDLDAIAAEVEARMMTSASIGALVERRELLDTLIAARAEGDTREGSIRLVYRIVYRTAAGDPTSKL